MAFQTYYYKMYNFNRKVGVTLVSTGFVCGRMFTGKTHNILHRVRIAKSLIKQDRQKHIFRRKGRLQPYAVKIPKTIRSLGYRA